MPTPPSWPSSLPQLRIRLETHERYSEQIQDTWYPKYVAQLGPAPGDTVLDVGCGFGAFHPRLHAVGARVVAFDYAPGMTYEARRQATRDGLAVQVLRADAEQIPLADNSNAFIFPTVDSALRYYASGRVDAIEERDIEGSHRLALLARMAALVGEIIAREGVFRVPKDAGSFVATVEA